MPGAQDTALSKADLVSTVQQRDDVTCYLIINWSLLCQGLKRNFRLYTLMLVKPGPYPGPGQKPWKTKKGNTEPACVSVPSMSCIAAWGLGLVTRVAFGCWELKNVSIEVWHTPSTTQLPNAGSRALTGTFYKVWCRHLSYKTRRKSENPSLNFLKFHMPMRNENCFRNHN